MTAPTAVVTGGAGDIGRAIAAHLRVAGHRVHVLDLPDTDHGHVGSPDDGLEPCTFEAVDVTDRTAVDDVFQRLPVPDVVIAAAGIVQSAPFLDITPQQWQRHLDVNLTGAFHVGQAAARRMVDAARPGSITMITSWVGVQPWPEIAAYSVSKAGLLMLTRAMAAELARHRIRVNALSPGIVAAGMARRQLETEPGYAARASTAVPLGRLQTADEVARIAAWLSSDAAAYLTGSVILADGGASLRVVDA
ncbi:SDR family NAD(P)-dependent oxidoreductase [Actinomycetes bacterium KLBMP 9797]